MSLRQGQACGRFTFAMRSSPRRTSASFETERDALFDQPGLPSRKCQIMRQSRSVSPRSITCNGVEPSNAGFDCCNHGPIALALISSASASKSRVTSLIFCTLERCGGVPAFQYDTVLGEAPVTRLTASFDRLYFRESFRTSPISLAAGETLATKMPFVP